MRTDYSLLYRPLIFLLLFIFQSALPAQAQLFQEDFGTSFSSISTTKWPTSCRSGASSFNTSAGPCGSTFDRQYSLSGFWSYIQTEPIAIPAGGSAELQFDYSFDYFSFSAPEVEIRDNGFGCGTLLNTITLSPTSGSCNNQIIDLSAYTGQTIRIRFVSNTSSEPTYLDDIEVSSAGGGGGGTLPPGACASAAIGNSLTTRSDGAWGTCSVWDDGTGSACYVWPRDFSNFNAIIAHTVDVNSSYSSFDALGDAENIYVDPSGVLNLNASYNTLQSFADFHVCGTVNINGGTQDFEGYELVIKSGGVVNANGGTASFDRIIIEAGGTLNLNGGEIRRDCGSSFAWVLQVEDGGLININNGSSELSVFSCFTEYTLLDGTIDCKNSLGAFNRGNFQLGKVSTTNNQSTGRIRTQTAYLPLVEYDRAFDANFFGRNSTWGGTVEYYGSSAITLDLYSRVTYYDLEVNTSGGLYLGSRPFIDVVGNLKLTGGNLHIQNSHLQLRGGIEYTGSNHIVGGSNARLSFFGKLSPSGTTGDLDDSGFPGMTTYLISTNGTSNFDVRGPELRMSSGFGGTAQLERLRLYREDVIYLRSNLQVQDSLLLDRGKLRTYPGSIVYLTNPDSGALRHYTTKFTAVYGYVSGTLERNVAPGQGYDFPVGYPNATSYAGPNHRRLSLDIGSLSGISAIRVGFTPGASTCSGALIPVEDGNPYVSIHPEGTWQVEPVGAGSILYGARAYTWGFDENNLPDNLYGLLKRPGGSTACTDYSLAGGTRPAPGGLGRVVLKESTVDTSFAQRMGWTGFSDFAIGVQDAPLAVPGLSFQGELTEAEEHRLQWLLPAGNWQQLTLQHRTPGTTDDFRPLLEQSRPETEASYTHAPTTAGEHLYRLLLTDYNGNQQTSAVLSLNARAATEVFWQVPSPHPGGQPMPLQLSNGNWHLSLLDLQGRTLARRQFDIRADRSTQTWHLPGLAAGTYLLRAEHNGQPLAPRKIILSP